MTTAFYFPAEAERIPPPSLMERAFLCLSAWYPTGSVSLHIGNHFSHIGSYRAPDRLKCLACEQALSREEMWKVEGPFIRWQAVTLMIDMPCCQATCNINDLMQSASAAYTMFYLAVPGAVVDERVSASLSLALEAPVRGLDRE